VQHGGDWESRAAAQFNRHLRDLAEWSRANGDHDVITVTVNLKNSQLSDTQFPSQFDSYVASEIDRAKLFTPGDLLGGSSDLVSAVRDHGWPTLRELRGKFIFCLTGSQHARTSRYTSASQVDRLCFCDLNINDAVNKRLTIPRHRNRVFYNFYPLPYTYEWKSVIRAIPERELFVIRAYEVNDDGRWKKAIEAGINILATDQVFETTWARVGSAPIVRT
jgi:hypothetical protein